MLSKLRSGSLLKDYIAESFIILLKDQDIENISVSQICEKAGVNRSTYYRNFQSKREIILYFYDSIISKYLDSLDDTKLTPVEYFEGLFEGFIKHKEHLIILNNAHLSHLLLESMNKYFLQRSDYPSVQYEYYYHYHIGGVFNAFQLWLQEAMETKPSKMAKLAVSILPSNFNPLLLPNKTNTKKKGSLC